MLSAPVVMAAPAFLQEMDFCPIPPQAHPQRCGYFWVVPWSFFSFWHMTLGCMSRFQGPSWDPFAEKMGAPSSKHGCSELNLSPQAANMIFREKKALLGCALCHPPVGIFKIGQSVAL